MGIKDLSENQLRAVRAKRQSNDNYPWRYGLSFIGSKMGHNFYLHYLIDVIFSRFRDLRGILELGTGHGALTLVLGLWAQKRTIPIMSIDKADRHQQGKLFQLLKIRWLKANHFESNTMDIIELFMELNAPTLLVCDGGDKIAEFNTFVPLLQKESIIIAHDWNVEIQMSDINTTVVKYCEVFIPNHWERHFVQAAIFKRV
ncbi:MAG: hypothetical protein ACYS1A_17510 [Planctomycetota bacterium]|jgi:hypothetical protein